MSKRAMRIVAAGVAVAAVAACVACGPADPDPPATRQSSAPQSSASPDATATDEPQLSPDGSPSAVATELTTPWSIAFHGDTALISERDTGDVLELLDDGSTRVIGTVPGVRAYGESGLLGLTVDDAGRLYAYSTGESGNRIQRFEVTGSPGSLALGEPETIIDELPAAQFHSGGRIAFGPDGMLYATVGDAGYREDAQDLDSLAGKILRMTPDGEPPADNPFDESLVYSYGHRNPQGIAWAPDGTMFSSEFGQNTWDELNVITPGGNYGWPVVEGIGDDERFIDPVQQWSPEEASPSGIAIAGGTIFIANLRGEVLRTVPVVDPGASAEHYDGEYGRLRDVTRSPDGDLWLLTANTDGRGSPTPDDDRLLSVELSSSG